MKRIRAPRHTQRVIPALGLAIAVSLASMTAFATISLAQNAAPNPAASVPELQCTSTPVRNDPIANDPSKCQKDDPLKCQKDPFWGTLVGPNLPSGLLPINGDTRKSIFEVGLPCQEGVSPSGQEFPQRSRVDQSPSGRSYGSCSLCGRAASSNADVGVAAPASKRISPGNSGTSYSWRGPAASAAYRAGSLCRIVWSGTAW